MTRFTIILLITFFTISCNSKKGYEDYNENDFYEVQGIVTYVEHSTDPFDSPQIKNIKFNYFLDLEIPLNGAENGLNIFKIAKGYPVIVYVHKDDTNTSFYGKIGLVDSLNEKEIIYLKNKMSVAFEKKIN
ncbi:hypothetical protein [Abyssalbus ytuae]|uniref:Lipoprotein n=1 Tax=Abyssalbus ytuae TaxID=2926907 RepID=A0A9E6ZR29_9FLAO|nr:hypothetical protein [Abyssalbus ytuae]UOB18935.1 hypothetical protein MQE35_06480 [Abyssalbus ytuae]